MVILYKFLIKKIPKFSVLHKGNLHKRLSAACINRTPHFCVFCILIFCSSHGILITSNERVIKINTSEINLVSRDAAGVKSMKLNENEYITDMLIS